MTKGKTKNIQNPGDDLFEKMDEITGKGGDMQQYESYEEFGVDEKNKALAENTKKLITSLCKLYLDTEQIGNDDYAKAIAEIEACNLHVLMKQVKYSEHILDSLMRQLDAGGYIDPGIYDTIKQMQMSAIKITLEVSRYTRNLPEYFKFLQNDMKKLNALAALERATTTTQYEELPPSNQNDSFSFSAPQRGLRELMLNISDVRDDLNNAINNSEEIIPTPIAIDDDLDDYEERLEDDLDEE